MIKLMLQNIDNIVSIEFCIANTTRPNSEIFVAKFCHAEGVRFWPQNCNFVYEIVFPKYFILSYILGYHIFLKAFQVYLSNVQCNAMCNVLQCAM